ncbi:hypothetical protein [Actinospongicola halichondriae]|uniref:hypothetical protein n=1 Tax=Actinospongicola halichondriae TaxID=3236844 RepID=UPI003D4526E0
MDLVIFFSLPIIILLAFFLLPRTASGKKAVDFIRDLQSKANEKNAAAAASASAAMATLVCPHCGEKGSVSSSGATVKDGISGGKATAAVFTGGLSLLGTGLSRKKDVTRRSCGLCQSSWVVE